MEDPSRHGASEAQKGAAPPCYTHVTAPGTAGHVSLCKGALVRVNLPGTGTGDTSGKSGKSGKSGTPATHYDAWTLTMDMRVDSLPERPQSILSCSSDVNSLIQTTRDETETLLYPAGALSIFDEMPPEGASMFKPGQWNRVSIRYGYEPEDRKKAGGGKPPSAYASFLRSFPGGGEVGPPKKRKLWVYVKSAMSCVHFVERVFSWFG